MKLNIVYFVIFICAYKSCIHACVMHVSEGTYMHVNEATYMQW